MTGLTRADLDQLPTYVPGRAVPGAIKLASNEVPYGPLPGVVEAIADAAANSHRYPDMGVLALRERIAGRLEIDADRVATGCGSVALAEHVARAACQDGDEILYAWRSFEAYPIITATTGARSVRVPNTAEHGHDLAAMAAAVTDRTRVILICNPNNPTGTAVRRDELDAFLDAVPDDVLVVIDEAYREFVTDPAVPDGVVAYGDRANVVVLRTLSKAWGLAGLRVGYLVAQPDVATAVRKVITPFSTSAVAQAAGLAALSADGEMARRAAMVVAERERVEVTLHKLLPPEVGLVPPTQSNFVWLPLGEHAVPFAQACEAAGIIVRPFAGEGVRVTVGTAEENDAFLTAAESFLASESFLGTIGPVPASSGQRNKGAKGKAAKGKGAKSTAAKSTAATESSSRGLDRGADRRRKAAR